ncbi:uncharacterized protein LY89DRAFT_779432 [Mollisia scopiformis]|uniref:Uncharacterized protein n=1 Tax=Mollisia scopiformis TaxID=149040 RepID=A0A194XKH2_MOLSC|nr:uncharacterized protein LY89DRAFT_779432 [Mollisia scopiformis]KUJ20710.1 hypothetical protein LY89DRAFT_779432 [Mollisia scopiformis]
MADSPAKRRKTSPTTSVAIDAPATPSRIPVPIASQSAAKTSARRPSFASPTKASLARHNPQLLNRPSSSGAGSVRPSSRGRNLQDVFAKALGETAPPVGQSVISGADREGSKSMSTTEENEPEDLQTQQPRASTPKARSTKPVGGGLSTKPRRPSRSPVKRPNKTPTVFPEVDPTKGLPEDFNPFQKKGLRRSPVPGQAELLPQQEVQQSQQENINPFRKTGLRRSPVSSQPVENVEPPQVEAPAYRSTTKTAPTMPTPSTHRAQQAEIPIEAPAYVATTPTEPAPPLSSIADIVHEASLPQQDEPPSDGIVLPEELLGSLEPPRSPRGQGMTALFPVSRPERPEPELPPTPTQRGIPDPIVTTPPTGIHDTPSKRARRSKALSAKLKSSPLKPRDPPPQVSVKEKQAEPQEEQKEQKKAQEEPVKRRKSARFLIPEDPHAAKKKARDDLLNELQQLRADVALANQENERLRRQAESRKKKAATADPDELIAMLTRATALERPVKPKPKPSSIFKSISTFLPFNPKTRAAPLPISEKPPPSHLPIALDDPLPYLQAFSGLNYTSTITLLPSDLTSSDTASQELEQSLMQKHIITASHPSSLFTTRFAMTVDTSALSISSVDILRLDMNAEKELGTFIRGRARDEGPLGRDITVICWAMSRWVEVSIRRAQFWCAVEQELGTPDARIKSLQRKRKRKRLGSVIDNDEDSVEGVEDEHEKSKWTRKQLLPHFGRSSMELSNEDVEVRFEWKINFDWTGEVDSSIAAAARVPKIWQHADERSSLSKVPETFEKLKKEKGPLGAVRAMVGLLMPPL